MRNESSFLWKSSSYHGNVNENINSNKDAESVFLGNLQTNHSSEEKPKLQTGRRLNFIHLLLCCFFIACGQGMKSEQAKEFIMHYKLSEMHVEHTQDLQNLLKLLLINSQRQVFDAGRWLKNINVCSKTTKFFCFSLFLSPPISNIRWFSLSFLGFSFFHCV